MTMNEEQKVIIRQKLHEILQSGVEKIKPKVVVNVTELIMDAYQEGFKTCWKLLTGKDYKLDKEEESTTFRVTNVQNSSVTENGKYNPSKDASI